MIYTIFIFIVILSILVIVHEMGHFLVAKKFGIQVEEFGLGFPPQAKILTTFKSGLKLTLNWLPLGGFVKLKGEDGGKRAEIDSFASKKIWQKTLVLASGVIMNIILAFLLLSLGLAIGWPSDLTETKINKKYIKSSDILITYVEKDSPADLAGLKAGDFIKKIDNQNYQEIKDLQEKIQLDQGREINILIEREKQLQEIKATPREIEFHLEKEEESPEQTDDLKAGQNYQPATTSGLKSDQDHSTETKDQNNQEIVKKVGVGVALAKIGVVRYPIHLALGHGAKNTIIYSGKITAAFYHLIKDAIIKHKISPEVGGPVAIAIFSGKAARLGFIYILQFIALLSLNLAIINILPFPALDGGRILFAVIEKIKGRAVSSQIETITHTIGFWLLIIFVLAITLRDIDRFGVWGKFKSIFK